MTYKKETYPPPFEEDEDGDWHNPDHYHEIKESELQRKLSHKYWLGVLVGMTVSTIVNAIAIIFFIFK